MKNKAQGVFIILTVLLLLNSVIAESQIFCGERRLIRQTIRNNYAYKKLEFKECRISIKAKNFELPVLKGNFKVIKDSAVQFSIIPAFGIEAGRIVVVKDSFFLVNRIQRIYAEGNWKNMGFSGLDKLKLYELQDLQLGNFPPRMRWISHKLKGKNGKEDTIIAYYLKVGEDKSEYPVIYIDKKMKRLAGIEWAVPEKKVKIQYIYKEKDFKGFPEVHCDYSDGSVSMGGSINLGAGTERKGMNIKTNIGRSYRKVEFRNWIKDLTNY